MGKRSGERCVFAWRGLVFGGVLRVDVGGRPRAGGRGWLGEVGVRAMGRRRGNLGTKGVKVRWRGPLVFQRPRASPSAEGCSRWREGVRHRATFPVGVGGAGKRRTTVLLRQPSPGSPRSQRILSGSVRQGRILLRQADSPNPRRQNLSRRPMGGRPTPEWDALLAEPRVARSLEPLPFDPLLIRTWRKIGMDPSEAARGGHACDHHPLPLPSTAGRNRWASTSSPREPEPHGFISGSPVAA